MSRTVGAPLRGSEGGSPTIRTKRLLSLEHLTIAGFSLVFVAAVLVHFGAVHLPFQWDDALILRDDNVRLGRPRAFLFPPVPRFLTWLSFMIQSRLSGHDPMPWHAANVFIHALNAGLVFLLLTRLLDRRDPTKAPRWNRLGAMLGATVFALHPVQSEAVFYIYQRSTLMSVGFGVLAWILYLQERRGLSAVAWVAAIACKESALVFPLVFWLSEGVTRGKWKLDRFLKACLGGMGLGLALHLLYWGWVGETTLSGSPTKAFLYLVNEVDVWWRYAALVFHLVPLNLDHTVPAVTSWPGAAWWCAAGGSLLFVSILLTLRRRTPLAVFFCGVFVILLLPTSSIVPSQDLMFEHRLYGSMVGWAGLVALVFRHASERLSRLTSPFRPALSAVLTVAVLSPIGYDVWATQVRLRDWASPETLWRDTARKSPLKYRPNFNLGVLLMKQSPSESAAYLERAVELDGSQPMAYRSLGAVYFAAGRIERARDLWRRALALDPDDADTLVALGRLRAAKRDYFGALRFFRRAQSIQPNDWRAYYLEARLDLDFGFVERAVRLCKEGIRQDPAASELHRLLVECGSRAKPHPVDAEKR